jgi:hypothetical protein
MRTVRSDTGSSRTSPPWRAGSPAA